MDIDREALEEWQKNQPLCILSLDPADRAVLRVAGRITKSTYIIVFLLRRDYAEQSMNAFSNSHDN